MTLNDAKESLTRYWHHGIPQGHFLTAVLENDLFEAIARADETSLTNLPQIVRYIYSNLPMSIYGSPEKVREHTAITTVPAINAFYVGVAETVKQLAINKNGEQLVGVLQVPLKTVLDQIEAARCKALVSYKIDFAKLW
jgi:hypothetical protein